MHKEKQIKLKPGLGHFLLCGQEMDWADHTAPGAFITEWFMLPEQYAGNRHVTESSQVQWSATVKDKIA